MRKLAYSAVALVLGVFLGFILSEKRYEEERTLLFDNYSVESARLTAIRFSNTRSLTELALDNEMDKYFDISCQMLQLELKTERETEHAGKEEWTMLTKAIVEAQKMIDRLEQLGKCKTEI